MSQEIQEIMKDYNSLQLHEHLFDGEDDVWLSKLDEIFDDMSLDSELFGKEVPSHYLLMSFIGGIIAVPLYLSMNFYSISQAERESTVVPLSFMGILEKVLYNNNFNFYHAMFNERWENVLIMLALAFLYVIKPFATTQFILSIPNSFAYHVSEILCKTFYVFVAVILIEKKTTISSIEGACLILSLISSLIYYNSCGNHFKESLEVSTANLAVKEMFTYQNLEEFREINSILKQLDPQSGPLDPLTCYNLLFDIALSQEKA